VGNASWRLRGTDRKPIFGDAGVDIPDPGDAIFDQRVERLQALASFPMAWVNSENRFRQAWHHTL